MWPVTLSGRLLIVALVGRYPTNQLIKRGFHLTPPEFSPHHARFLCAYAVLAVISNCCPQCEGRLPTRYSPVRHSVNPASIRKLPLNRFVRLACVKHAASVHPEPGSNSHVKVLIPVKIRLANFNRYYCCFGSSQNLHFAHRVQLAHACKQSWTRFHRECSECSLELQGLTKSLCS